MHLLVDILQVLSNALWGKFYPSRFLQSTANLRALAWDKEISFLISGHDLACQQEVSLALTKTLPIQYYNAVDSAFSNYAGLVAYLTGVSTAYCVTCLYANGIYA